MGVTKGQSLNAGGAIHGRARKVARRRMALAFIGESPLLRPIAEHQNGMRRFRKGMAVGGYFGLDLAGFSSACAACGPDIEACPG
jgi:hypothetical protein